MTDASERALQLFVELCDLSAEERDRKLAALRAADPVVHSQVSDLLRGDRQTDPRLGRLTSFVARIGGAHQRAKRERVEELLGELRALDRSFGRYTVVKQLAAGGMSTIHAVHDSHLDRRLAMKTLPAEKTGPDRLARFVNEVRTTGRLDHPGILPVHDVGVDTEGQAYFTMQLVEGWTLAEVLDGTAGDGAWPPTRVVNALLRACEAVAFAHSKGIVHRDLKPSNVMVGRFGEVFVMDWGVAFDPLGAGSAELGERIVGTPHYMSPEQAGGVDAPVGSRSDVYSMGAILYRFLAGHAPYADQPPRSADGPAKSTRVLQSLRDGPPTPLAPAAGPPELLAICEECMQRDPEQRYEDVTALAADLRAYLELRVVRVHAVGAWPELRKWIRRNRAVAASLVVTLVVALAGLTSTLYAESRGRDRALRQRDSTTRVADVAIRVMETFDPAEARGREVRGEDFLDLFAVTVEARLGHEDDAWGRARYSVALGRVYRELGLYDRALPHAERGARLFAELLGPDSLEALHASGELGMLYMRKGRLADAETLVMRALERYEARPEEDRAELARALGNVATVYHEMADYERATRYYERVRELLTDCPEDDLEKLTLLEHLGSLYRQLGRYTEAEELLEQVIAGREAALPPDHPHTIHAHNSLGLLYLTQKRWEEAEEKLTRVIADRRQVLGDEHADTLRSIANLASALCGLGEYERAEPLYEEALRGFREVLVADDQSTVSTLHGYGLLLRRRGKKEAALEQCRDALDRARRALHPRHPLRYLCANSVAFLSVETGRPAEGERLLAATLPEYVEHYGERHPNTQEIRFNLAKMRGMQGRTAEADALLELILRDADPASPMHALAESMLGAGAGDEEDTDEP